MSGLDIESLRLPYVQKAEVNDLIEAQLAKAMLGFEMWLRQRWQDGATFSDVIGDLEQSNIERPTS